MRTRKQEKQESKKQEAKKQEGRNQQRGSKEETTGWGKSTSNFDLFQRLNQTQMQLRLWHGALLFFAFLCVFLLVLLVFFVGIGVGFC
jgi:hypothetical protein